MNTYLWFYKLFNLTKKKKLFQYLTKSWFFWLFTFTFNRWLWKWKNFGNTIYRSWDIEDQSLEGLSKGYSLNGWVFFDSVFFVRITFFTVTVSYIFEFVITHQLFLLFFNIYIRERMLCHAMGYSPNGCIFFDTVFFVRYLFDPGSAFYIFGFVIILQWFVFFYFYKYIRKRVFGLSKGLHPERMHIFRYGFF